jgi:CubicO group peptidase (beta-lactamase class C family)
MSGKRALGHGFAAGTVVGFVLGGFLAVGVCRVRSRRATPADPCPAVGDEAITAVLEPVRQKHGVPAIAAAIVTSEGLQAVGAVGVRKAGTDVPVTLEDKWHLGSDTKAMTALLAADLVRAGKLRWSDTLGALLPEDVGHMHPDMRGVTLKHLLSHRAGLPANLSWGRIDAKGTVREQRQRVLRELVGKKPLSGPGDEYLYSNAGYVVVGAVLERLSDKSWEELIRERVFAPLGMESAGFGGTGTPGKLDQPWGHRAAGEPVDGNGPGIDNPPVIGPAGRVNCTIQDWAKFVADQLRGVQGKQALLPRDSYRALHSPPFGGEYALGWIVVERGWGEGTVLNHCGCNTMNYANVWVAPKKDFAVLICINQGDQAAFKATDECAGALIRLWQVWEGE